MFEVYTGPAETVGQVGHLPYHFLVVNTGNDVAMIFTRDNEVQLIAPTLEQTEDPLNNLWSILGTPTCSISALALQTTVYTVVCQFAGKFAANSCI